ncbi:MAG: hypothetical protein WAL03_13205, partial [Pseudolabrys sp.]
LEFFVRQLSIAFRRFCYTIDLIGADGGTRTLTGNLPRDFKSVLGAFRKSLPVLANLSKPTTSACAAMHIG